MGLGLKKNDTVVIVTGNDKGKKGRVLSIETENNRLVVESLNMIKKHMKPNKQYSQGGIIEKEAPVHRSNVMFVCPKCSKPTRIGTSILESGKKFRVCKKCREVVD